MANRTRPKQMVIRLSEEEFAQIKEKVEQSGKNQQQYVIEALTKATITNTDGIKELIPELKRVGNNINQIARSLNEGEIYPTVYINKTLNELEGLWQLLRRYLQERA
jgi:predicted lactoylglutathione lyase